MERWTSSLAGFRRLAIVTVVLLCVLVVSGAVVRLTGSGLGCDDWPACNDTRFLDVSSGHAAIEQVNRIFSGLIAIPIVAMVIGSFRVRRRRAGLVGPSLGVLASVLANGVVGGMAVRGDLHPALVQSHFVLAMLSIGCAVVAAWRARPDDVAPAGPVDDAGAAVVRRYAVACTLVAVGTAVALVTGTVVTGTGPHAGDEDVRRFEFDISAVARVHSIAVLVTVALAVVAAASARRRSPFRSRFVSSISTWMFVAVLQGTIGYVQYFSGVPAVLAGLHVAGATVLWVLSVRLVLEGRSARAALVAASSTPDVAVGAIANAT